MKILRGSTDWGLFTIGLLIIIILVTITLMGINQYKYKKQVETIEKELNQQSAFSKEQSYTFDEFEKYYLKSDTLNLKGISIMQDLLYMENYRR